MATTVLDPEAARERILQSLLSDEDVATGIEWTVPADVPPDEAAALLDLGPLREALERDRVELGARAARHVTAALDTITGALAAAGIELPASAVSAMPSLERERHVWVQAQEGTRLARPRPLDRRRCCPARRRPPLPRPSRRCPTSCATSSTSPSSPRPSRAGPSPRSPSSTSRSSPTSWPTWASCSRTHGPRISEASRASTSIGSGLSDGTRYTPLLVSGPQAAVAQRPISIGGGGGRAAACWAVSAEVAVRGSSRARRAPSGWRSR